MRATSSKEVAWRPQRRSGDVRLLEVAGRITEAHRVADMRLSSAGLTSARFAGPWSGSTRTRRRVT